MVAEVDKVANGRYGGGVAGGNKFVSFAIETVRNSADASRGLINEVSKVTVHR